MSQLSATESAVDRQRVEALLHTRARWGIALTGGIATGKSTVAAILRNLGAPVIDADQLARAAVAPGTPALAAIASAFGAHYIAPDGSLDRAALRREVFARPDRLEQLERITHPAIHDLFHQELDRLALLTSPRPWVYDVPLLFESNLDSGWREIWVTHCSPETQLRRVIARDGSSESTARDILARQWPIAEKTRRATFTISTELPPTDVERLVTERWQSLR